MKGSKEAKEQSTNRVRKDGNQEGLNERRTRRKTTRVEINTQDRRHGSGTKMMNERGHWKTAKTRKG